MRYYRNYGMPGAYSGLYYSYYDRIWDFEDMPEFYFKDIREFIDSVEAAPVQDRVAE